MQKHAEKIRLRFRIILVFSCLALLLAWPVLAQEQAPKETGAPGGPEKSPPKPAMAPSPEKGALESPGHKALAPRPQEESLHKKKVTDTVGGQEIRAKEKAEENR